LSARRAGRLVFLRGCRLVVYKLTICGAVVGMACQLDEKRWSLANFADPSAKKYRPAGRAAARERPAAPPAN
jgi:hypothetical protein